MLALLPALIILMLRPKSDEYCRVCHEQCRRLCSELRCSTASILIQCRDIGLNPAANQPRLRREAGLCFCASALRLGVQQGAPHPLPGTTGVLSLLSHGARRALREGPAAPHSPSWAACRAGVTEAALFSRRNELLTSCCLG